MDELGTLFAHALHAVVARLAISVLCKAVIVVVGIRISNILAELPLIVAANRVIVDQLSIGRLILFDVALSFILLCFGTCVHAKVFSALLIMSNGDEAAVLTAV